MAGDAAIRLAVDLLQLPSRVRHIREGALPDGMEQLLRVAVGEEAALQAAGELTSRPTEALRKAAGFFIEQILLADGSDSYRVLGSTASASTDDLRRHMALLVRYLHPDVAGSEEKSVFVNRVTFAWNDLKTPERRAAYDTARANRSGNGAAGSPAPMRRSGRAYQPVRTVHAGHATQLPQLHEPSQRPGYLARLLRRLRGHGQT